MENKSTNNAHALTYDEVAKQHDTNIEAGLTQVEAAKRLQQDGENKLKGDGGISPFKIIIKQYVEEPISIYEILTSLSDLQMP